VLDPAEEVRLRLLASRVVGRLGVGGDGRERQREEEGDREDALEQGTAA
jgi:hypothetical protein